MQGSPRAQGEQGAAGGSWALLCMNLSFFNPTYSQEGLRAGGSQRADRAAFVWLGHPLWGSGSPHTTLAAQPGHCGAGTAPQGLEQNLEGAEPHFLSEREK